MTQLGLHLGAAPLAGAPTPAAQQELLTLLREELQPLVVANKLPQPFVVQPGLRLSRSWGNCRYLRGTAPVISIRCTTDGAWRTRSAITLTLLHELAHLKYRSHGPRFWDLHRRLVDQATHAGLYHPHDDDAEIGRAHV